MTKVYIGVVQDGYYEAREYNLFVFSKRAAAQRWAKAAQKRHEEIADKFEKNWEEYCDNQQGRAPIPEMNEHDPHCVIEPNGYVFKRSPETKYYIEEHEVI